MRHVTPSGELGRALVEAIDEPALRRLAERLAPYLSGGESEERWLDAQEAAGHLGLTVHALHKLTAAREIPFEQDAPGCKLWFERSELDRWRRGEGSAPRRDASTPLPRARRAAS
jgi:hypothetical protein